MYTTPNGAQLSDDDVTESDWAEEETWIGMDDDDGGELGPWFTMVRKIRPACAFLIHEVCWSLLEAQFADAEIDLDRLLEVCRDIPPQGRADYTRGESFDFIIEHISIQTDLTRNIKSYRYSWGQGQNISFTSLEATCYSRPSRRCKTIPETIQGSHGL